MAEMELTTRFYSMSFSSLFFYLLCFFLYRDLTIFGVFFLSFFLVLSFQVFLLFLILSNSFFPIFTSFFFLVSSGQSSRNCPGHRRAGTAACPSAFSNFLFLFFAFSLIFRAFLAIFWRSFFLSFYLFLSINVQISFS